MPHMNRIRVNNVKYNFGTQQYDDFVMRLHGKNTIYDLANGGGKSVLMLLLLQNLIPNCTLDEKQPVEKLFRTSGGSTTIHSLIEWKLDACDIKEGYRFMLTGFCARKAKDAADEETGGRDTAAIEYFNYCIFYRAYNAHDLVNLPLVKDNERITYNELHSYLRELERNVPELKVYVFDRKGEYQQFISRFGLYESSWEIIRGINKTEGHVRTYFETNYKTTRKVVEDLLIEEIIEKSFRDKMEKENLNEDMAKTLLDMRDKLMELSEKKSEMGRFAHQKELLTVLLGRVEAFRFLYQEKERLSKELLSAQQMLNQKVKAEEENLFALQENIKQQKQECLEKNHVIACLKVQQEECQLKEQEKQEEEALLQCERWQKKMEHEVADREQKECTNDYLEYQQIKQKRDEQAAIIDKAKQGSGNYLEQLYDYASIKKKILDDHLMKQEEQLSALLSEEKELANVIASCKDKEHDLECKQAVQKADLERVQRKMQDIKTEMLAQKNQTGILLLEDVSNVLKEKREQKERLKETYEALESKEKEHRDNTVALAMKKQELEWKKQDVIKQQEKDNTFLSRLQEGREQAGILAKLYQVDDSGSYETLLDQIKTAVTKQLALVNQLMAESQQNLKSCERKIEACEKGLLLADDTLLCKVQEHLATRHGLQGRRVQEVLSEQSMEEREELLRRFPFAPYGLVFRDITQEKLDGVVQDEVLKELAAECMFPIFNEEMLAKGEYAQQPGMLLLHGDERGMYEEDGYEKRKQALLNELKLLRNEQEQLEDNSEHMKQELFFILQQEGMLKLYLEQSADSEKALRQLSTNSNESLVQVDENGETLAEKYEKEWEALIKEECQQQAAGEQLRNEQEQTKVQLQSVLDEIVLLEEISDKQKLYEELTNEQEQLKQNLSEQEQLRVSTKEMLEQKNQHFLALQEQIKALHCQMAEAKEQWTTLYAPYYQERPAKTWELTEAELDTEFASMKAIVEQGIGSVSDKQVLVDTLQDHMQKILEQIESRGVSAAKLQSEFEANTLYAVSKEEIKRLSEEIAQAEQQYTQANRHLHEIQKTKSRLEGRVEHGMKQLADQGIHYQPLDIPKEDIIRALEEQKQVYADMQNKQEMRNKEYNQKSQEHAKLLDFLKDVKRSIEWYHLQAAENMELTDVSEYTMQQLKDCQKQFEKAMEQEKKARQELEEYKQQTAQALGELKAYELAEVIRKDMIMPKNLGQMQELLDSLKDMIGFIGLEEERVEQGIADMQMIKSNFENQCIRRCQDVKTELERLPKLSSITLDGEKIQIISLHIPYISEERAAAKMSEYIDRIVKGVDQYETFTERMRYIRQQLALKRLFSVIVTDMNAIRLNLYKRERMREQSRYLRYEEAVGSTGQSQGIYIQFLIGIINYIANIHSVSSDNNELGKVIFIDNPFGAAKDIYIWEPIFEMLKTNNVQLIVPARGATPAITSRFDVNYVLGQKMSGKTQQTVVVDYRSQVEKAEMEYKMVEFSQNSFEFI